MADNTYAELCLVKATGSAKIPKRLDLIQHAALPLVTVTGKQLITATEVKAGQAILLASAAGSSLQFLGSYHTLRKYFSVKSAPVFSHFDGKTLEYMAEAVRDGKLVIPIRGKRRSAKQPRLRQRQKRVVRARFSLA